jgi:hypothetical protein
MKTSNFCRDGASGSPAFEPPAGPAGGGGGTDAARRLSGRHLRGEAASHPSLVPPGNGMTPAPGNSVNATANLATRGQFP